MRIDLPKGTLDLSSDFRIQIDETNPIMNDRGSQSVPVTVPATINNMDILGQPCRLDGKERPLGYDDKCKISDGATIRHGRVHLISADKHDGIQFNIGFDNAQAYSLWRGKKLRALNGLPVETYSSVDTLINKMQAVFSLTDDQSDYKVFTMLINDEVDDDTHYRLWLNQATTVNSQLTLVSSARKISTVIDGEPIEVSVPKGYGITPFLRIGRILDLIFRDLGLVLTENPFVTDEELRCVCALNNTADACTKNTLNYAHLMPDCTVEQFLQAIYARFGAVYIVNTDTNTAYIRLLRDIIAGNHDKQLLQDLSVLQSEPSVTFHEPTQLKLSAGTSLPGAEAGERFEDFFANKGNRCTIENFRQDIDPRIIPFPAENHYYFVRPTGQWFYYNHEEDAGTHTLLSSSFFPWDKQTEGVAVEEISSPDECVPMDNIIDSDWAVPLYLKGAVHMQTILTVNNKKTDDEKSDTPLAFLLALPTRYGSDSNWYCGGTVTPYITASQRALIHDEEFSFSLLWQFEDGLFAQFWKDYDAILRHSFDEIHLQARLTPIQVKSVDMLARNWMNGQPLIPDHLTYDLPSVHGHVMVDMTLRKMLLQLPYDLDVEQEVIQPEQRLQYFHYELQSTTRDTAVNNLITSWMISARLAVVSKAHEAGYESVTFNDTSAYSSDLRLDYTGYVVPEHDTEVENMMPEEEGLTLTRNYTLRLSVTIMAHYHGSFGVTQRYTAREVSYSATFKSVS